MGGHGLGCRIQAMNWRSASRPFVFFTSCIAEYQASPSEMTPPPSANAFTAFQNAAWSGSASEPSSGFKSHRKLKVHADEYIDKREMGEREVVENGMVWSIETESGVAVTTEVSRAEDGTAKAVGNHEVVADVDAVHAGSFRSGLFFFQE